MKSSVISVSAAKDSLPSRFRRRPSKGWTNSATLALHRPQWPRAISPKSWVRDHLASPQNTSTRPCPPSSGSRFTGRTCFPLPSARRTSHRPPSTLKRSVSPSSPLSSGLAWSPCSRTVWPPPKSPWLGLRREERRHAVRSASERLEKTDQPRPPPPGTRHVTTLPPSHGPPRKWDISTERTAGYLRPTSSNALSTVAPPSGESSTRPRARFTAQIWSSPQFGGVVHRRVIWQGGGSEAIAAGTSSS
mmetsp:Transcript_19432/g.56644  ORF Transcript_19432/g.56644 Transcript_19432/m.56644 type:complete len:247 (+) Transcript_19432:264-1004(+)